MAIPPVTVPTYWGDMTPTETATRTKVVNDTPGMGKTLPYTILRGSAGVDLAAPQLAVDAASLFPVYDGVTNRLPDTPATFANPTAEDFYSWHTAHQLEYLKALPPASVTVDGQALQVRSVTLRPAGLTDAQIDARAQPLEAERAAVQAELTAVQTGITTRRARIDEINNVEIPALLMADPPLAPAALTIAIQTLNLEDATLANEIGKLEPQIAPLQTRIAELDDAIFIARNDQFVSAMLSADGQRVILVNALEPTDIAKLSIADQRALTTLTSYNALLVPRFGLTPARGTTPEAARDVFRTEIDQIINQMVPAAVQAQLADFRAGTVQGEPVWQLYFSEQLEFVKSSLDGMAVFHPDTIRSSVGDIVQRYERVQKFATMTAQTTTFVPGLDQARNALDEGASVRAGFDLFLRYESQIYSVARQALDVARTGLFQGQRLDAPGLTFILQTFENYEKEHEANALTEELNQQTKLLQDYTQVQRLINETLRQFDATRLADPEKDLEYLGVQKKTTFGELGETDQKVVSMFNTATALAGGNTLHPIEQLKSLVRPTLDFTIGVTPALTQLPKSDYDAFALNISNATKTINQDSQIKMDEAGQLNKQRNRHYDLATNTLNKMSEMLRSIID